MSTATVDPRLEMEVAAMKLVQKARMHIAIYHCFFGALQEKLKLRVDWRCKTMYTDAVVIGFNPKFVLSKSWPHLLYISIHEVDHCALGHPFRRGDRDPDTWNEAIDHVVNLSMNRDPELKVMMPPEGLADERFNGMAAEEVYAILWHEKQEKKKKQQEEQQKQQAQRQAARQDEDGDEGEGEGEGDGDDEGDSSQQRKAVSAKGEPDDDGEDGEEEIAGTAGSMGDCADAGASGEPLPDDDDGEDGDEASEDDLEREAQGEVKVDGEDDDEARDGAGNDDASLKRLEREWQEAVMTAQVAAGGLDADMKRAIKESQVSRKSFLEYVDEFAAKCTAAESSWSRPARRFETYLPSYCVPGVKCLVVGVDTSMSIRDEDLGLMESAAQHVMDDFGLKSCIVVYCDTAVRGVDRFEAGEAISLKNAKGGGGTRFHPVLRYAKELQEQGEEIAGVIYLTDLMGPVADAEDFREMSILWATTSPRCSKVPPEGLGSVCCLHD